MNQQIQLRVLIWCGFTIFVQSVSDLPRIPVTSSKINPSDDEITALSKSYLARRSLLGHGNGRTVKDLEDIRKALRDLSRKITSEPPANEGSLSEIRRLPRYDIVVGAPEKLSVLNKNLRDFLFQTDILASAEDIRELTASLEKRQKRKATSEVKRKWPVRGKGVIPYSLDSSLSSYKLKIIAQSIRFWEENSCVKFQLHGKGIDKDSIHFYSGDGCYSYVGKDSPNQDLSIGDGCEYFGIVTHEIAHALGFYHEQERYDRNKHVEVIYRNIKPDDLSQFQLVKAMNIYGIPYDFGSVMHYESDAFAIDSAIPTIRALNQEYQQTMGQGRGPSFLDVLEMNRHYNCIEACRKSNTHCLNGGYPNPKNCHICTCPTAFGGRFCEGLQPSTEPKKCGGVLSANHEWKTFSASLGTSTLFDEATICYWHIKAPATSKIQVKITHLQTTCVAGCFYASLELKTDAQFVQSGHTHCCSTDNVNQIYTSKTNLVPVIAYANLALSFTIQYKEEIAVTSIPPTATSAPLTTTSSTTSSPATTTLDATTPTEATTPEVTSPLAITTPSEISTPLEATTPSVTESSTEAEILTDIPCPIKGTWSAWSPEISPKDCCGFCAFIQRRTCESAVIGCPCDGADIKRIDCNNNVPCPATPGPECCHPWIKIVKNATSVCKLELN